MISHTWYLVSDNGAVVSKQVGWLNQRTENTDICRAFLRCYSNNDLDRIIEEFGDKTSDQEMIDRYVRLLLFISYIGESYSERKGGAGLEMPSECFVDMQGHLNPFDWKKILLNSASKINCTCEN